MFNQTGNPAPFDGLSFEAAYDQLTRIVQQLDAGTLPLDEAVTLFEQGRALAVYCQTLLNDAELRISQIEP